MTGQHEDEDAAIYTPSWLVLLLAAIVLTALVIGIIVAVNA